MSRIWTSFAISLGLRQRTNSRPTAAAGRDFDVVTADGAMDIFHMSLSQGHRLLVPQVVALLQFIDMGKNFPATNATSERSFSALRLPKSYLRTTTLQERLNYLMLLHVHKKKTDILDVQAVVTEFVGESEHRCGIFAAYI